MKTSCPLCQAIDEQILWENENIRIIGVDDPHYPGFLRVIWKDHVQEMTDLSETDQQSLMKAVFAAEACVRKYGQPDKINLASLGNQVPHLHWHVIPRWKDDRCFPDSIWSAPQSAGAGNRNQLVDPKELVCFLKAHLSP